MKTWKIIQDNIVVGKSSYSDEKYEENIKRQHFAACKIVKDRDPDTMVVSVSPDRDKVEIQSSLQKVATRKATVIRRAIV